MPIFLDSSMASNATNLFCKHLAEHRLDRQACETMCNGVAFTRSVEQSKAIYLIHDEPDSRTAFAKHLQQVLGWNTVMPEFADAYWLGRN